MDYIRSVILQQLNFAPGLHMAKEVGYLFIYYEDFWIFPMHLN